MTWKIGSRQNEIRCTKRTRQTGISSKQRHNPRLQFHVKWSAPDSSALFRLTFRHPLCTFEESRTACHLSWSQFSIQLWLQIETSSVPAIPCLSGTHRRDSPISLEHSIRDTDPNATGGVKKSSSHDLLGVHIRVLFLPRHDPVDARESDDEACFNYVWHSKGVARAFFIRFFLLTREYFMASARRLQCWSPIGLKIEGDPPHTVVLLVCVRSIAFQGCY